MRPVVDHVVMDVDAIKAAAAASAVSYRSFADATRSVLDLLERQFPEAAVYLAHLDRGQDIHRIVDTRNGERFGLRSNLAIPLSESLDVHMADDRAPRLCNDLAAEAVYRTVRSHSRAAAYLGVPLELSDGSRVGALGALSPQPGRFEPQHEQLLCMLARVLAYELERETNERDLRRLNEALRGQARGVAAVGRAARALAVDPDPRPAICAAACEAADAPIGFLLEPAGDELTSTAMSGISMAPVTIQARGDAPPGRGAARAFSSLESYFVPDARDHPAVATALAEATKARSALFEPIVRDGQVAGVLIIVWTEPVEALSDSAAGMLRLIATQGAAAIEQAALRARVDELAMTDTLTGLVTRRRWEEEVPRELARARRAETPVCLALVDLDHMSAFNMRRGEQEGDRLIKEAASAWTGALREVDLLARLDGAEFGVLLPGCTLGEACDVVDRVRDVTPRGQTASAGVARWNGEEPADLLVMRCADALATAKAAGRDMTIAAEEN